MSVDTHIYLYRYCCYFKGAKLQILFWVFGSKTKHRKYPNLASSSSLALLHVWNTQSQPRGRANLSKGLSDSIPETESEVWSRFVLSIWVVCYMLLKITAVNVIFKARKFICLWWKGYRCRGRFVIVSAWGPVDWLFWDECITCVLKMSGKLGNYLKTWWEALCKNSKYRAYISLMVYIRALLKLECNT